MGYFEDTEQLQDGRNKSDLDVIQTATTGEYCTS
jgi:hypothetical protein